MNYQFTSQQSDSKRIHQSNSSNAFGTGNFPVERVRQPTFQPNESQVNQFNDSAEKNQRVMSFQKQMESNGSSNAQSAFKQSNVHNQTQQQGQFNMLQQYEQDGQYNSQSSLKRKGASNRVFVNQELKLSKNNVELQQQSQFNQPVCQQHNNKAQFICSKIGCNEIYLCDQCYHSCEQLQPIEDYFKVIQFRIINQQLDIVQNEKEKILTQINSYFYQLKLEMQNQIDGLYIKFITKVFNDTSFNIELCERFVDQIFQVDFCTLNNQVTQLSKLIFNDFLKPQELSRVFVQDQNRLKKKIEKNQQLLTELFNNFIYCCEQELQNNVKEVSQVNLTLQELPTEYHYNKAIKNSLLNMKLFKTISLNNKSPISDMCLISNHLLATADQSGQIILWKLPYFVQIHKFQHGSECTSLQGIKNNENAQYLLSAGKEKEEYQIYIWNIDQLSLVGEFVGHSKPLRKIVALPSSQIAWCQDDSIIRIWKLTEYEQAFEIKVHSAWINDLCKISKTQIASCSRDNTVAVIDFYTGSTKFIIKDVTYVNCVISINSELFAFANHNGQVKIYQVEQPQLMYQIQVSNKWIESNSIWFLHRITNNLLTVGLANGEINIIQIDLPKDQVIKQINKEQQNINNKELETKTILYIEEFKLLLIPIQETIKIMQ